MTVSENQNAREPSYYNDLKKAVDTYINAQSVLARSMDNVRIAFDEKSLDPNTVVLWPEDSVYICADAAIAMFSSLLKEQLKNSPEQLNEEVFMDLAVQIPSLTLTSQAWNKSKVVLNLEREYSQEEIDSFGKIASVDTSKFPCWGIALNLSKQNIYWNDTKVKYAIFNRYFLTTPNDQGQKLSALPGESAASINNITTNIFTEDGNMSIGPILMLVPGMDIDSVNDTIMEEMVRFNVENMPNTQDPNIDIREMIEESYKTHCTIYRIFAHALQSLNSKKDIDGNDIVLPQRPGIVLDSNNTKTIAVAPDVTIINID